MARHELHLKLTLRLYSDDDQRCFGPGIATLLERVVVHRSLRAAAASMGMAYSKAWRIIRTGAVPGPFRRTSGCFSASLERQSFTPTHQNPLLHGKWRRGFLIAITPAL